MRKIILLFASVLAFNLTSCNAFEIEDDEPVEIIQEESITKNDELRGMWLSFYEISEITKDKTEAEYRHNEN